MFLATQQGGILGPFAFVLGKILEFIYNGFAFLGIYNIGLCIILFTIVVRMLMLPMQVKQQKFSKLNSVMQPEIQKIQKKYKDKKDQASQMAQQEEIKAVYAKYGTSPTGSCLQLIIQMPILFALYRVIMNIPAYVAPVKSMYIKVIHSLSAAQMTKFFGYKKAGSTLSGNKLNKYIDALTSARGSGVSLKKGVSLTDVLNVADKEAVSRIKDVNDFFGLDIGLSPSVMAKAGTISLIVALIIPLLSGIFQFVSVQLSTKMNKAATSADNGIAGTMGSSMKIMNFIMPLFSIYMCYILQTGIGIYWCVGSLVMMVQQLFINMYLNKKGIDAIIEESKAKADKKAEKKKEKKGIYREEVIKASQAKANVKDSDSMSAAEKEARLEKARAKAASGSGLAAKANLVKDFEEKNK